MKPEGPTSYSGSRQFTYFKPKGRHPTEYEDLTLHTQPDPHHFAFQGWLTRFADGRGAWNDRLDRAQMHQLVGIPGSRQTVATDVCCGTGGTGTQPRPHRRSGKVRRADSPTLMKPGRKPSLASTTQPMPVWSMACFVASPSPSARRCPRPSATSVSSMPQIRSATPKKSHSTVWISPKQSPRLFRCRCQNRVAGGPDLSGSTKSSRRAHGFTRLG